jgi:uncharacterized protein (TIGR02270 family)
MLPVIESIVAQHADEARFLWSQRDGQVSAPQIKLYGLARTDERLTAHLDGLDVAGDYGRELVSRSVQMGDAGALFVAGVRAISSGDDKDGLDSLLSGVAANSGAERELISAFGWVSPGHLRGVVMGLLESSDSAKQRIGIAACALHRVDPSAKYLRALGSADTDLAARALRCIGELGQRDLQPACLQALGAEDRTARFWAATSAVLLGNRGVALEVLKESSRDKWPLRLEALRLALAATETAAAHALLTQIAQAADCQPLTIIGSGIIGDPRYVPWLIDLMGERTTARSAAEAFSTITGVSISSGFDLPRPKDFDDSTAGDEGDAVSRYLNGLLPWPDAPKIQSWWNANSQRFQPGVRYFMGQPLNRESCLRVLNEGFQRQRILAAHYLCLLNPGTVLFNTSAPAWRQQRLLAQMN